MATISQTPTPERSTRVIIPTFTDTNGDVIPLGSLITPTWTLTTKQSRTVINSRSAVSLTALQIVLTGPDLAIVDDDSWRVLTLEAQYNSATYGNGLYIKQQYEFPIEDLSKITA
jgi:hypothetical protein